MPRFPIAHYAALLAPDQRGTFANFAYRSRERALAFIQEELARADLGLPLRAKPRD